MRTKGGTERVDLPVLREMKGRMRAFRNMHSVTVLNVPQLRELSVSVAFMDVKEVKMENASLLGKCEELKRAVEKKKSDDVVVRVKDVGVLPVEKRVVKKDSSSDCDCGAAALCVFLIIGGWGLMMYSMLDNSVILLLLGVFLFVIAMVIASYQACKSGNCC